MDSRAFFEDLFEQNLYFNGQIISALETNQGAPLKKCIHLVGHLLNAHVIWNSRINSIDFEVKPWSPRVLDELSQLNKDCHDVSIQILRENSLDASVEYATQTGKVFCHKVNELLFQIVNHSTYHRGQIAVEFRRLGVEPLFTDYIYYKMTTT